MPLDLNIATAPKPERPVHSPSTVKYHPRPVTSNRGPQDRDPASRHCATRHAGGRGSRTGTLRARVDQQRAKCRVEVGAPEALDELENKGDCWMCGPSDSPAASDCRAR